MMATIPSLAAFTPSASAGRALQRLNIRGPKIHSSLLVQAFCWIVVLLL
jgi:hypothetical protein